MHMQVLNQEKPLEASKRACATITADEEDKENECGNSTPHRQNQAMKPPSSYPVTVSPFTHAEQYSARSLTGIPFTGMPCSSTQHQDTVSDTVSAALTPRDGQGPLDTAAAAANEAVYSSLGITSAQNDYITPRVALAHGVGEHAAVAVATSAAFGVNQNVPGNPAGVMCWSGLSSPEDPHMHGMHASQVLIIPLCATHSRPVYILWRCLLSCVEIIRG
jgi:hypothetical protein